MYLHFALLIIFSTLYIYLSKVGPFCLLGIYTFRCTKRFILSFVMMMEIAYIRVLMKNKRVKQFPESSFKNAVRRETMVLLGHFGNKQKSRSIQFMYILY